MATFILKNTTNAASVITTGQLEFNTDKKTLVVGDGTNEVVIAKMNVENEGSFLLTGDIKLSGSIYLGDNLANDTVNINSPFSGSIIPSGSNVFDLGSANLKYRNVYATSISGAIAATNGVISGSSQIISVLPTGLVSGSSQINFTQINGISNNIISASTNSNNIDFIISGGSITANLYGGVISGSSQILNALPQGTVSGSSQVVGILSSLNDVSSSLNAFTASQYISNSYFATTGSNNFYGNQSISGNVYLTGSLIPSGSASYDLGSQTHPFQHLYVSSGSIYMDGTRVMGAETRPVKIGDSHEGGIVFYIANDNSHCLIIDSTDTGRAQSQYLQIATGATGTAIGTGQSNTNLIMARSGSTPNAYADVNNPARPNYGLDAEDPAFVCHNLVNHGFSDWYLPSVDEMREVGKALPNFIYSGFNTSNYYWTSTYGGHGAYTYYTIDGSGRTSRPLIDSFQQQPFRAIRKSTNLIIKSGLTLLTNTTYSGSITTLDGLVNGIDISASVYLTNERLADLESGSMRLEESTASLNLFSASLNAFSASENTKSETLRLYTASVDAKFTSVQASTASINAFTQSIHQYTSSTNQRLSALETQSGSDVNRLNNIESYTASLKTAIGVSGTNVTIAGNLTVQGTTTAVNSTTVQLGDNIIELNGNSAVNGGIVVKDPTAPNTFTGSLIWDSTNDYWKAGTINNESKILLAGADSVVTSSAQVVGILQSLNQFSSSINTATASLNLTTASLNTFSASENTKSETLRLYTASIDAKFSTLQTYTASVDTTNTTQNNRLTRIEESTASLNAFSASENTKSETLRLYTASIDAKFGTLATYTGSNDTTNTNQNTRLSRLEESTSSLNAFTSSQTTTNTANTARFTRIEESTASLNAFSASENTKNSTLQTYTASIDSTIARLRESTASLNLYTQSNDTTNTTQNTRLSRIEESTSSLNTFSASINGHVADINSWSASVKGHIVDINEWTGSQKQKDTTLQNVTASLNLQTASFNTWTASVYWTFESSSDYRLDALEYSVSVLTPEGQTQQFTNINQFTQSANIRLNNLEIFTASVDSTIARLKESTASLNLFTQSYSTHSSSFDARLDVLEAYSSSQTVPTASYSERTTQVDILVKNESGAQIDKGKVVRISGAHGDNPLIVTASFLTEGQSANTLGITTQNIPNDSFGYVVTEGILLGVDTNGMTAGQLLYLGANGTFTTTPPTAPNHGVRLGEVLRAQQNNGSIYVRVDNGSELGEAHDVVDSTTNSSYGDFLMKSGSVWINNSTFSASVNGHILDINAYTASNNTTNAAQSNRLTRLEESTASINSYTASLKTAITIAGSDVTLNGNLTVAGTTTTINSTTVNIGDNIIQLNGTGTTNGGLVVRDATAATTTSGSLLWDTTNDRWIAGPLGAEAKVLTDGMGVVSGSVVSSLPTGVVSGSSQVNFTQLSGIPTNIVSASSDTSNVDITISNGSISANLFGGVVSGSAQVVGMLASLNFYTQSNDTTNTTQNTRLSRIEESTSSLNTFTASLATTYEGRASATKVLVSGSSQVNFTQLSGISANIISGSTNSTNVNFTISGGSITANLIGGVVSGSSQISYTGLSNIPAGIVSGAAQITPLLPTGTVSGSAQVVGMLASLNSYTASNDTTNTNQNNRLSRLEESTSSLNTLTASLATTYEGRASATKTLFSSSAQIGNYVATITGTSNQVVVAGSGNNAAAITLSTPQNIHTAATPQFASLGIGMAASGTTGRISASDDIIAFASSDIRFKSNIKPIENALQKVEAVGGYGFDWDLETKSVHGYDGHDIGVIAQEIEKIAPELVTTRENGYKAVKYEKIVPLLIEAIKELSAKVKELENK